MFFVGNLYLPDVLDALSLLGEEGVVQRLEAFQQPILMEAREFRYELRRAADNQRLSNVKNDLNSLKELGIESRVRYDLVSGLFDILEDTRTPSYFEKIKEAVYHLFMGLPGKTDTEREVGIRSFIMDLSGPQPQIVLDLAPLVDRSVEVPKMLSWKGRKLLIDTGFIVDFATRFKGDAPLILDKIASANDVIILESIWDELKLHHNVFIGKKREIDEHLMYVIDKIHNKGRLGQQISIPPELKDQVLISYYDLFKGDSRKYVKDPLGENDQELVELSLELAKKYPVVALSTDAHVNRLLSAVNPNVELYPEEG